MPTPQDEQQSGRPRESIWVPLYGRAVRTRVLANYHPATNRLKIGRRWHGENVFVEAQLPPRDATCDDWLPVMGEGIVVRLCWYNPAKHRIKVQFRWHGAQIVDYAAIPEWGPAPHPPIKADDRL